MLKKLLRLFLLVGVGMIALKLYLTYSVYALIEDFKADNAASLTLHYDWLSTDYQGGVAIEGLQLTVFQFKRQINIEQMSIKFDNLPAALSGIPDLLESPYRSGIYVHLDQVTMPMKGKSLTAWFAENYGSHWLTPFELYACSSQPLADYEALRKLGIDEVLFNLSALMTPDNAVSVDIELPQIAALSVESQWGDEHELNIERLLAFDWLEQLEHLQQVSFEYRDRGFVRRVRSQCSSDGLDNYAQVASKAWETALNGQGLIIGASLPELYSNFMNEGGVLKLDVQNIGNVLNKRLPSLYDKNLASEIGLTIDINAKPVESLVATLDKTFFAPKPPEKAEDTNTTPEYRPEYRLTAWEDLPGWLDKKVLVELESGKRYEGLLTVAYEHKIDILVNVAGGEVTYSIKPHPLTQVKVWR